MTISYICIVLLIWFISDCQYSSIQRQLNLYGFRCLKRNELKAVFFHPQFIRGHYESVKEIKRIFQRRRRGGERVRVSPSIKTFHNRNENTTGAETVDSESVQDYFISSVIGHSSDYDYESGSQSPSENEAFPCHAAIDESQQFPEFPASCAKDVETGSKLTTSSIESKNTSVASSFMDIRDEELLFMLEEL